MSPSDLSQLFIMSLWLKGSGPFKDFWAQYSLQDDVVDRLPRVAFKVVIDPKSLNLVQVCETRVAT